MIATQPTHPAGTRFAAACLATLMLAVAACSSTNPTSPSASTRGSGAAPTATVAPSATPAPTATAISTATTAPAITPAALPSAATPSPSPEITLPTAAHTPQSIHLILHPTNDTVGSLEGCSDAGTCQGDYMIGDDPLVDPVTGKEVGTFAYECFLVDVADTLFHCPGVTITLTGRGLIVFTELIEHEIGKPPAVSPITGGTGEFLGATGTVTAKVLSGKGDFVVSITG
jgi:hypothetical protein